MTPKIRIVVGDGQPILREGLRSSLERDGFSEVVAEAGDGYASTLAVATQRPDVVILDAELRKLECYDAVVRIHAQSPDTRILVMFTASKPYEIEAMIAAGVSGFIRKTALPQEYQNAVRTLVGGGTYFSKPIVGQLFAQRSPRGPETNVFGLTGREIEILRFICGGFSNKDIARRCGLSVRTVETHRLNIRRKTSAGRLRDLVRVGRQLGLVDDASTRADEAGPTASDSVSLSPRPELGTSL